MKQLNILNTREVKKIREKCVNAFGKFLEKDYAYLKTEKGRIFVVNKDISRINLEKLRIDKMGLYFAEDVDKSFRLSKEGAQLLVKEVGEVDNLVELDSKEVKAYFKGEDLEKNLGEDSKLVILKCSANVLGCARYKEGKIFNYLPKIHRGTVIV